MTNPALSDDPQAADCIAMLEKLVAFDTTSRNSNLDLIHYLQGEFEALGIATRLTHNDEKTKANLWATVGPVDVAGGIVLSGHTDVVPVDGQDWASDPFVLTERGDKLYGRGSCDMKGFVACAAAHAARMAKADLKTPLHFAFSYDEEIGCIGVLGLVEDMKENLPQPAAVLVGEPTSMQIVGGNKGGRGFVTTVHGVDGHSSAPALGANAIFAASRIISFLQDLQQQLVEEGDPENGFDPYYTTVDCGLIEGGTAHNIIPARCTFHWGFRVTPGTDADALVARVMDFIEQEIEPGLKAVSSEAGVTHEARHALPPTAPDETSAAERLVRHLTGLNHSGRVSYGTEGGHFQTAGVPVVIFGPGSIEQAHLPDEWITVEQMHACHAFMEKLTDWAADNAPGSLS